MYAKDQRKVALAGFTIIRADLDNKLIKCKTEHHPDSWRILEKGFKNKAAVMRRMKELLEHPLFVED